MLWHEAVTYVGDDKDQLSVGSGRLSEKADFPGHEECREGAFVVNDSLRPIRSSNSIAQSYMARFRRATRTAARPQAIHVAIYGIP